MKYYIVPPPMNPVLRLAATVLAALVLAGAFFFGLVVLIALGGAVFLSGLVFALRTWWLRRVQGASSPAGTVAARDGQVIDAEYTVVSRRHN